jgi:LPXTG-motif cell wall-anchored protein
MCSNGVMSSGLPGTAAESDTMSTTKKTPHVAAANAHQRAVTLPNTGAGALAALGIAGLLLVVVGTALVSTHRRRNDDAIAG